MEENPKLPTHYVYYVRGNGRGARWTRPLGAVWPHKDGKGFSIELDAIPVHFDGKLVLREPLPKDAGAEDQGPDLQLDDC